MNLRNFFLSVFFVVSLNTIAFAGKPSGKGGGDKSGGACGSNACVALTISDVQGTATVTSDLSAEYHDERYELANPDSSLDPVDTCVLSEYRKKFKG